MGWRSAPRVQAAAAAIAEARKNRWNMAIAIVDTGGYLVYFEKMQDTQTGSVDLAIEKARTSALFRRPTKVFQEAVAAGGDGLRVLHLPAPFLTRVACRSSSAGSSWAPWESPAAALNRMARLQTRAPAR